MPTGRQRRKVGEQVGRVGLEHVDRLGQAAEPPGAETPQADPVRERVEDSGANGRGHHGLAAVRGEADARGGVHREAHVAGIRELGAPAVQADPQEHVARRGPTAGLHRPVDRERGVQRRGGAFEDREDVVAARGRHVAARLAHRGADQAAHVAEQRRVPIAEAREQLGRTLDIGQQEGDLARGELALRLQLRADEADRHDPVLLGRPQQPAARPVAGVLVLEGDLAEPRERIAHVRRVVDRQTASPIRIDVGEGAVRKLRALFRGEGRHARMIARHGPARRPSTSPSARTQTRGQRGSGTAACRRTRCGACARRRRARTRSGAAASRSRPRSRGRGGAGRAPSASPSSSSRIRSLQRSWKRAISPASVIALCGACWVGAVNRRGSGE